MAGGSRSHAGGDMSTRASMPPSAAAPAPVDASGAAADVLPAGAEA
jgi:hypothetical protein